MNVNLSAAAIEALDELVERRSWTNVSIVDVLLQVAAEAERGGPWPREWGEVADRIRRDVFLRRQPRGRRRPPLEGPEL